MKTIGLTGGVGMGKSACAQLLAARGAAVMDTDELARQVVQPGQPALAEVVEMFGRDIIAPDGRALPCPAAAQIVGLGIDNVRDRSLGEIWQHSAAFTRFRRLR